MLLHDQRVVTQSDAVLGIRLDGSEGRTGAAFSHKVLRPEHSIPIPAVVLSLRATSLEGAMKRLILLVPGRVTLARHVFIGGIIGSMLGEF